MLPSNEKAKVGEYAIMLNSATGISSYLSCGIIQRENGYNMNCEKQHLYFLSEEEEIKEGDWFVMNGCIVRQCKSTNKEPHTIHTVVDTTGGIHHVSVCKKIIATTDTYLRLTEIVKEDDSIEFPYITSLPQPSQSFIEKFVEEYNKVNIITEVRVEYIDEGEEDWFGDDYNGEPVWNEKIVLKVNPKDNTITIRKVKDSWSSEEVNELTEVIKELKSALLVCSRSLATYGSHPIIENHVKIALNKVNSLKSKL